MADYKVGNLQIAFEAINNTSTDFKELAKNLRALQKLILNIGNADITPFVNNIKALRKEMTPLLNKISGASQGIADFNAVVQQLGVRSLSKASNDLERLNKKVVETSGETKTTTDRVLGFETVLKDIQSTSTHTFDDLNQELLYQQQYLGALNRAYKEAFNKNNQADIEEYGKKIVDTKQAIQELKDQLKGTDTTVKKSTSGWKKFIKSIGRIALYRAIRRALQLITQSITETIQEFAKVDDNVNDTMSHVTSSLKVIQLSFGATWLPLLQIVQPILSEIAESFANFANTISQATATGETYWAINSKAIQDYREQLLKTTGTLASFDKINSLNQKNTFSFLEEREVDKQDKKVQQFSNTIERITSIISNLWDMIKTGWHSIEPFVDDALDIAQNFIIPSLTNIFNWIGKITKKIDELGLTKPVLYAVLGLLVGLGSYKIINGILSLTSSINGLNVGLGLLGVAFIGAFAIAEKWGDMNWWQRLIGIVGVATTAILGLAIAMGAFQSAWSLGVAAVGIIAGITAIVGAVTSAKSEATKSISNGGRAFAKGGIPSVGTLFYAGEAGAETVTVGSSGRTEVTNVSQMETALYNALVRHDRESSIGSNRTIVLQVDGKTLATVTEQELRKKGIRLDR